jgi:hypothetical protein
MAESPLSPPRNGPLLQRMLQNLNNADKELDEDVVLAKLDVVSADLAIYLDEVYEVYMINNKLGFDLWVVQRMANWVAIKTQSRKEIYAYIRKKTAAPTIIIFHRVGWKMRYFFNLPPIAKLYDHNEDATTPALSSSLQNDVYGYK